MATLTVRNDQRVGAIGKTRSGKTYLMGKLLAEQPRVLVIDSKHRVDYPGFYLTTDKDAALLEPHTIFRHDGEIPDGFWRDCLDHMHEAGGGIVYADELPVLTGPNRIPPGIARILRMGGELGVSLWYSAQESTGIHNTALRQTDVLLLFLNQGASDRDKLIRTCGDIGEVTAHLMPWQFVVYENFGEAYNPTDIPVWQVTD